MINKGKAEGRAEGIAEGRAEGKGEGKNQVLKLMQILFNEGKTDEAQRASNDKEYCDKLLVEYGIA